MRDDLIVVPVFSGGQLGPTRVAMPAGAGGLRHASVVFCEEIRTIDRDFLARGPVGLVAPNLVDAIIRGVRRAIGEVLPEP
jgi:mRNA-degrading endonuclease toxin of MazEF toxin-antitoxin module